MLNNIWFRWSTLGLGTLVFALLCALDQRNNVWGTGFAVHRFLLLSVPIATVLLFSISAFAQRLLAVSEHGEVSLMVWALLFGALEIVAGIASGIVLFLVLLLTGFASGFWPT